MIEIEAKLKVNSLEPIGEKLAQIGAKSSGEVVQTDYYFDDGTFAASDKALRLRHEIKDGKEKIILCYKGPREAGIFKRRQEIQFGIDSAEKAVAFLSTLGFEKAIVIQKHRSLWQIDNCEVALDELPELGTFVEIEGPSEEVIADVQSKLGLSGVPHIKESYAALMRRYNEAK